MLTLTDDARERIRTSFAAADPPRTHLRIRVELENGSFAYRLAGMTEGEIESDDHELPQGAFTVVLDPDSADRLEGATLDWRDSLIESGFVFDNPNTPASPVLPTGERDDLEGPVSDRVRMLLENEINPAIAAHGGRVTLVDVKDDRVYLAFGGGCHGCGMVDVTLKQGIETRIREAVPEVAEVVDTTDHSTGENPYY